MRPKRPLMSLFARSFDIGDTPELSMEPTTSTIAGSERLSETERVTANGAVRFYRLSGHELSEQDERATAILSFDGDGVPLMPVTVTSYGALCSHKLVKRLAAQDRVATNNTYIPLTQLDGHARNHSISLRPSHELEPTYSHDHRPDEHETAHSLKLHNLIRAKGTWRTRMQRTRCWRCALHDSRVKGWQRAKKMLTWTCFCRFRAYEEDSEDEEREREERLREMGVRGGLESTG
jgi:hypothetical protein